ncbi:MAG TPA: hypothetical protein VEN81_12835 [Planctomycetota bacterium]|nr:hypothetical protein [Planctomycetota bacterium]
MKHVTQAVFLSAALAVAGCMAPSSPLFEAESNRTLKFPDALARPGSQARVLLPDGASTVLVWRTEIGFGGAQIRCTHCGGDLRVDFPNRTLECPSGFRFHLDGSCFPVSPRKGLVLQPLRAYVVEQDGDRLKILG